jgi:hypothetical protein
VVSNFKAGDILTDSSDNTSDFVTRYHWESSWTEIFTCLMNISVANTGELYLDVNIIIPNSVTSDFMWDDWTACN